MLELFKTLYQKLKDLKSLLFNIDLVKELKINKVIGNVFKYEHNSESNTVYNLILPSGKEGEEILQTLKLNQQNNIRDVGMQFQERIKQSNISNEQKNMKLSNPDFVEALIETHNTAQSTTDVDKRKMLSDLIYQKFISDDEDISNTISQAIRVMKNLTKNHLKILSFLYIFRSGYLKYLTSAEQFMEFYKHYISKLVDMPYERIRDIGTSILANGCAVQYAIASNLHEIFEEQLLEDVNKLVGNDLLNDLAGIWYQTGLASSFPTEVGKNIAKTYLHEILGIDIISKRVDAKDIKMTLTSGDVANIYKFG